MAAATNKATLTTTLVIGQVEVPVALFSATVDKLGKLAQFDTAGPNGGRLMAHAVARPVPVDQVPVDEPADVIGDPLGEWESAARERVEQAPDGSTAAREALAAEAEGHAREVLGGVIESAETGDPALAARLDAVRERLESEIPEPLLEGLPTAEELARRDEHTQQMRERIKVAGEYGRELVEEGSGVVVAPQDVRRGVRLEDGRFIDCTAQLARIEEETRLETMRVIGFVDVTQIPRAWAKGAKYLGAGDEKAPRALRIIFEGLKSTRRAAIVKLTKRSRQTLAAIVASRGVLMLYELVWREDFREPPARAKVIQQAAVHEREVGMFMELVSAMSMPAVALDDLRDDAIEQRELLKAQALAGEVLPEVDAEVINEADELAAQLAASLAAVGS